MAPPRTRVPLLPLPTGDTPRRRMKKRPQIRRCLIHGAIALLSLLLAGCDKPTKDELHAYRAGYGIGKTLRAHGSSGSMLPPPESHFLPNELPYYEKGLRDGKRGKEARYEFPD